MDATVLDTRRNPRKILDAVARNKKDLRLTKAFPADQGFQHRAAFGKYRPPRLDLKVFRP